MARRATKDTYATESIGGVDVRRKIKAGSIIPPNWALDEGAFKEVSDKEAGVHTSGGSATDAAAAADKAQKEALEAHRNIQPSAVEQTEPQVTRGKKK